MKNISCHLQKPDTVAMVVREVMVSAVCNTSKQPQLNQGSVEFNVTDEFLNSTRFTRHNISLTFSAV